MDIHADLSSRWAPSKYDHVVAQFTRMLHFALFCSYAANSSPTHASSFYFIYNMYRMGHMLGSPYIVQGFTLKPEHVLANKGTCTDWPRGYTFFSYSTQLNTKFILLINVKMPTIVGILTFISTTNTTPERLKLKKNFMCRYFSF